MAEDDGIGSVRDYIATEIAKRTEVLKSIVKSEYSSILDASDVINQMIEELDRVQESVKLVDQSITEFHTRIKSLVFPRKSAAISAFPHGDHLNQTHQSSHDAILSQFLEQSANIWDDFDAGNINDCLDRLDNVLKTVSKFDSSTLSGENRLILENIQTTLSQTREKIKSDLQQKIESAPSDQIGIITGNDQDTLYKLSLESVVDHLSNELIQSLSDMSFHAQIRRYRPNSLFNCQTNEIESDVDDSKPFNKGLIQIPKSISPELGDFLYKICQSVNVIAGLNITRSSIISNLETTIERILVIYNDVLSKLDELKGETKRRRALQLYFDLMYVRILLNTSKNIDSIERLDPKITELTSKYELHLDSIELYMISTALHSNVMKFMNLTIRLHGLLIPHLQ